ncbi:hypothetical protein GCM10027063_14780 [Promicromonospora xylanilytica]
MPVTVSNAGDKPLSVDVAAALGDGWAVDPAASLLDVPAEGKASVDLTVTPTAGAAPGDHTLEVTATWGPWTVAGQGTVALVGDVTEVRPGTPAEERWLVADDGSALAEAAGGYVRYADNESTFTYRVPLADARAGTLTLDIANQFLVEASSDRESWTTVLEETGSPIFESNRAERTLDVAELLAGTGSTDGSLYLRVGDSSPGDGWGGKLFRTRLEIPSMPEGPAATGS